MQPHRLARTFVAVALIAALVLGTPVALWSWTDPHRLLSIDWAALTIPGNAQVLLQLLGIAGWMAWLWVAATVVAEFLSVLSRGRLGLRVPGARWARPPVRALVAAALGGMVLTPLAHADDPGADHPAVHSGTAGSDHTEEAFTAKSGTLAATYTVQPGDELWSIAETHLGSGERWRDIADLNRGLDASSSLTPGQEIVLPPAVVVEKGDTLWELAEEHLGSGTRWPELHEANTSVVSDPDLIDVGWRLVIPIQTEEQPPGEDADPAPDETPTQVTPVPVRPEAVDHPPPVTPGPPGPPPADAADDRADDPPGPPHDDGGLLGPVGGALAAGVVAGVAARRRLQLLDRAVGRRVAPLVPELQRLLTALVRRGDGEAGRPHLGPTGVILGWDGDAPVLHDLESARCTLVTGSAEDVAGVRASLVTSLSCAEWSHGVEVVLVADPEDWAGSLDDPSVRHIGSVDGALVELQRLCARRRIELGSSSLPDVRGSEDLADAWAPLVFIFCTPLAAAQLDRVGDCLDLGQVGISVVVTSDGRPRAEWEGVCVHSTDHATRQSSGDDFHPQLLTSPARRALLNLFVASSEQETESAYWWRQNLPANVSALPSASDGPVKDDVMPPWPSEPQHPTLLMLGPAELIGCRGRPPSRAVGQCVEYCAWILHRPGSSASTMTRDLLVAEPTRRSNMSRLRTWLGSTRDGDPYLPDAYSGRISLHPAVSSDWERFQLLLSGGVNTSSTRMLREALALVRGEPLAGATFQWPWATTLLADMVGMITDAAVVLAERSMDAKDAETARWAIERGRWASPESEPLDAAEVRLLALRGEHDALQQKVMTITRAARAQGRDLSPETIRRIQGALHRSRAAT